MEYEDSKLTLVTFEGRTLRFVQVPLRSACLIGLESAVVGWGDRGRMHGQSYRDRPAGIFKLQVQ